MQILLITNLNTSNTERMTICDFGTIDNTDTNLGTKEHISRVRKKSKVHNKAKTHIADTTHIEYKPQIIPANVLKINTHDMHLAGAL
jgi:hypothetical protein